ncbi:MAG: LD-carboxypeptidase [Saprospiraceae bacterium]|nr:LD-carboxypeptidase [Saprospiraceae bacterium]
MDRRTFGKKLTTAAITTSLPFLGLSHTEHSMESECSRKLIKPKRLKPGDTIGLVTPAGPITEEQLKKTITNIEGLGFNVEFNERRVLARNGYLAGSDLARADEVNLMFANPDIDGIWCIRGGYGVARMLDMLNYKVIRQNPKVLIGYSDITALHQAIYKKTGLVCFHGPVGASTFTDYTTKHVKNIITNPQENYTIEYAGENADKEDDVYRSYVIKEGIAEGTLIGGNLTLAASLVGTPYDVSYDDKLVFLEDIGEKPYRIDRMLTQMLLAGKFNKVKGVILGVFYNCEAKEGDNSLSLDDMLIDRFNCLNVPIIYGMSFGHIDNQFTLPLGIYARLNTADKTITLLESSVI